MKHKLLQSATSLLALVALVFISLAQGNQAVTTRTNERTAGAISGRVVNESGRPMPNVRVSVSGIGRQTVRRTVITDETGKYVADSLPRGSYSVFAQANGYVFAREPQDPAYYRPGEAANLTLKKGAAITGTVTNSLGEPVVGVPVNATLVRNSGLAVAGSPGSAAYTDDRGVYRLFGLPAGSYLVASALRTSGSLLMTAYADDAPTYYPSATRDTAVEVPVQYGAEASGIDIRYRGELGYTISGKIADPSPADPLGVGISVLLTRASNDSLEAQTSAQQRDDDRSFALYGVPDGDYYLTARRVPNQSDDGAISKRVLVKIRGRDVTGVAISLIPNGSIAGRLTLDVATMNLKCESIRSPAIEETIVTVQTDGTDNSDQSPRFGSPAGVPDSKGDFVIRGLPAGRFLFDGRSFLDEGWYLRAVTVPGPTNTPVNASHSGITVRPGQRINGIRVVLGEGAASLRGRIVTEAEGAPLPDRLRIHLVPAEPGSANDILRFSEAEIHTDGSFKITNLAPGRYLLVTRQRTDEEAKQRSRPLALNATERARLLRMAQAANTGIALKPCERVADYKFRYAPPQQAPPSKQP